MTVEIKDGCRRSYLSTDRNHFQADPSLRWAHMSFCWFCRALAHFEHYFLGITPERTAFICIHGIREVSTGPPQKLMYVLRLI